MFYANFWFLNSLCTLSYTSQKCFCILCSLVTKILKNVVILFSKTWPDKTKSSNIMCIWCLKARENLKILIWHKSFVHPIPVCLLEFNKVGCTIIWSFSKNKNFRKIWKLWLKNSVHHAHFNFEILKGVAVLIFKININWMYVC